MTAPIIQFKRGAHINLPGLRGGEPGFTTDKYDLYVGLNSTTESNQFFGSGRYWEREDGNEALALRLVDKDGSNSINLKGPDSLTGVTTYTFPATPESNKFLITDDDGNLSWGDGLESLNISGIVTATGGFNLGISSAGNAITTGPVKALNFVGAGNTFAYNPDTDTIDISIAGGGGAAAGSGEDITLGSPTDGSYSPGALDTINSTTKVVDSIDDLNELALNMLKGTAVSEVDFSADKTTGGSPLSITLTPTFAGNADLFDVDWGDGGNVELDLTLSQLNHTYNESAGGLFSITLNAKNNSGSGAGSEFAVAKNDYITVYTPDPEVRFNLYRNASGGSLLSGNDLYVVEGQSLYLKNTTTNTSGFDVDYSVTWGDGNTDSVADDASAGGVDGSRLEHTWADGTSSGTGLDTLTVSLDSHNGSDPSVIPTTKEITLKVYDDSPAQPDGLSTKSLTDIPSTGDSPRLASGATDNTGASLLSDGDVVDRVVSGSVESSMTDSFAYGADTGSLTANVSGSADGSVTFTFAGDESGTYDSLIVTEESDYQLLDSTGSPTTFQSSIYYPGLYKGFKARISKPVADLAVGANSFQLQHSTTGNTNTVSFVKDDLTSDPTTDVSSATVSENVSGVYRYISGVPYYNSGSPSLTLSGVTIEDLVGQCYTNQNDIVEVNDGVSVTDYSYSDIDGSTTMLTGGIPNANVGTASPYTIGDLVVPITTPNVRTESQIRVRAKNVNGVGNYSSEIPTKIQVHTSEQFGISEIAIPVEDALGNGTHTDDGIRIFDFSGDVDDTPTFNNATNFYTNDPYTELIDPGIEGTQEAMIRDGQIQHDTSDYSTGYLPAGGPDRSGDTGTQYFTFAFRRQVVANFDINIESSGVAGLWIALPGTAIDTTSGLNGWLRSDSAYSGAGVPGTETGGNGSNGCAFNNSDLILPNTSLSGGYTMTLGEENMSNATGNVVLVRIALTSGQSISSLNITEAAV